jgi:hypothetical protein
MSALLALLSCRDQTLLAVIASPRRSNLAMPPHAIAPIASEGGPRRRNPFIRSHPLSISAAGPRLPRLAIAMARNDSKGVLVAHPLIRSLSVGDCPEHRITKQMPLSYLEPARKMPKITEIREKMASRRVGGPSCRRKGQREPRHRRLPRLAIAMARNDSDWDWAAAKARKGDAWPSRPRLPRLAIATSRNDSRGGALAAGEGVDGSPG